VGLKVDGIATSEHIDSSGEILIIENHDISDLVEGKGVLNFEHSNKHEDIVGAVIYAKKILKKDDCENERQRKYWDFVKKPYVYIIGELFDDQEHPGAIAVAAMVRYYASKKEKMLVGFSIEGATLERDGNVLKQTVGRRVAMTLRSCNKTAIADLYEDAKSEEVKKSIEFMSKNIDEAINLLELDSSILTEEEKITPDTLFKHLEDLNKTLTAGMGNIAPSALVGGAALSREYIDNRKNRVKAAVRDWNRKRPLKEIIKAALPEVSDEYIDTFVDLAEDLALKKGLPKPQLKRIGKSHGHIAHDDDQNELIEGLYMQHSFKPAKEFHPSHKEFSRSLYDLQNDAGTRVLVKKPESGDVGFGDFGDTAHNASSYYRLAKDYFGLGKNVPTTAMFAHPELHTGNFSAMAHIPDAKTPLEMDNSQIEKHLDKHFKSGDLHKLMMMDHILGHLDRHSGNIMLDKKGNLYHIDNDLAMNPETANPDHGFYFQETAYADHPAHPEAHKWLNSLDPAKLAEHMLKLGLDKNKVKGAVKNLKNYQNYINKNYSLRKAGQLVSSDVMFGGKNV
jgi:hypothetical protein